MPATTPVTAAPCAQARREAAVARLVAKYGDDARVELEPPEPSGPSLDLAATLDSQPTNFPPLPSAPTRCVGPFGIDYISPSGRRLLGFMDTHEVRPRVACLSAPVWPLASRACYLRHSYDCRSPAAGVARHFLPQEALRHLDRPTFVQRAHERPHPDLACGSGAVLRLRLPSLHAVRKRPPFGRLQVARHGTRRG